MFSTAFKFINNLWANEEEDDKENEDVPSQYPTAERSYGTFIDGPLNANQNTLSHGHKIQPNREHIKGTITHVFGDYGLINEDIYFSLSSLQDRACPVVGASIQAVVESTGENGLGTREAVSVSIVTDWFDSKGEIKEEVEEVVVGKITTWDKRTGTINDQIPFTKDALPYDFKAYRGDWVKATVVQSVSTGKTVAKAITPLREKHFSGVLTHAYPGYGYVDGTIYFSFASCDGFKPEKGDWLTGVAIESDQNRGKWRGVKIHKKSRPVESKTNVEDIDQQPQVKWKEELFRNKCGVIITEFTDPFDVLLDEKLQMTLIIKNTLEHESRLVKAIKVSCCAGVTTLKVSSDSSSMLHPPFTIPPAASVSVYVTFCPRYIGRTAVMTMFQFNDFEIVREIPVTVLDAGVSAILDTVEPITDVTDTKRHKLERWKDSVTKKADGQVMSYPGVRPTRIYDYIVPVKLPGYPVSNQLQSCIMNKQDVRDVRPVLTQPLLMENYSQRFSALLHLEEIQMDIDIRMFDMERVSMKPWREFLSLEVPGLAEGRPSVLVGDKIILSSPEVKTHNFEYDGFVHEVHGEHILMKFNPAFHESYQAERYNVRFTFSRTPLRRCHQACEFAVNLGVQVLFPAFSKSRPPQVDVLLNTQNICYNSNQQIIKNIVKVSPSPEYMTSKIKSFIVPIKPDEDRFVVPKVSLANLQRKNWSKSGKMLVQYFNKSLNPRQKAAVVRILQGESRPIPYVLFGPPGTGKTITVVEAILQVHKHMSHSRVLACTPSNSAADLLVERLHASGEVTTSDMVRLNAFRRQKEAIPEAISPYCTDGDDLALVARHRIIVTTCGTAGTFYQLGLKAGHFTHVFLDEAGQATEPEAMVVVGLSTGQDGQSIITGDPRQLGPVLRSDLAKGYGLEQSLLERLMDRTPYMRDAKKFRNHGCYDPLLVTKLVDNYRSHPALLKLSSRLFYHGELEPKAERNQREALCKWKQLPNKEDFPLMFHGIKGKDLKEGNSPSWFNPVEAVQAVKYLQALLADNKQTLTTDDVGIITPYRKQVEKINLLLASLCIQGVKVGSVEEFQGQERMAIIISTVRADESLIGFDRLHQLGFVSSPKRFNVAITRPKALLIIVGNPHVLASDSKWRALLQYCMDNDAYIGCDLPDLSKFEEDQSDEEVNMEVSGEGERSTPEEGERSTPEDNEEDTRNDSEGILHLDNKSQKLADEMPQSFVYQADGRKHEEGRQDERDCEHSETSSDASTQGVSPERAVYNLQTILSRSLESPPKPALVSPGPSGDGRFTKSSESALFSPGPSEDGLIEPVHVEEQALVTTKDGDILKGTDFICERLEVSLDGEGGTLSRNAVSISPIANQNGPTDSDSPSFQNEKPLSSCHQEKSEQLREDSRRANSGPNWSPRSSISSRSSSPALSDAGSGLERRRRRVTPSTPLLGSKLACNFQQVPEGEEDKLKLGEKFIKGKGRGLIIQNST